MVPQVKPRVFALLYGDHHALHKRLLDSFDMAGVRDLPACLWLNTVCDQTRQRLKAAPPNWRVFDSPENIGKYKAMRTMFEAVEADKDWNWVVWFDDDSYIETPQWLPRTLELIGHNLASANAGDRRICYVGKCYLYKYTPGLWRAVKEAKWYKGVPPALHRGKQPIVNFATGAYFWLKRETRDLIDWPDPRLNHDGGDTLLAEAVRQQGLPFHKRCVVGVSINKAGRRGYREPRLGMGPAGAGLTWKDVGIA